MPFWQLVRFQEASSGDGRVKVNFKEIGFKVESKEIGSKVKLKEIKIKGKGKNDYKNHPIQEDPHFSLSQNYFKQFSVKDQLMSNLSVVKFANKSPNCALNANLWPSQ